MNTKVSQMTVDELREVIGAVVEEKLAILLTDTEDDLELIDEVKARLSRQTKEVGSGERGESLEDVTAHLGLN